MGDPADLPEDMIDSSLRDQEYMPFIPSQMQDSRTFPQELPVIPAHDLADMP